MAVNKSMLILRGALLLSLFGAGASQLTGCAQDVGTVDRTRPDKVKKSIFEGDDEWYYRQTVIEGPTQGGGGVGGESPMKRIRWTITEDTLFAYSTTEPAIGTEKGLQNEKDRRLGIVAAFPIVKHFDIQRGYSSSTGQLSNTIEENTSDRLWYQRDYMRVDWSRNQIDGILMMGSGYGRLASIARSVPESDSTKDFDRARISEDNIDVVTEYYYTPDYRNCGIAFGYESMFNCEEGPVKIRNSFIRVPKTKTFEPTEYFDYKLVKDEDGKPIPTVDLGIGTFACDSSIKDLAHRVNSFSDTTLCQDQLKFNFFSRFGYFRTERAEYSKRRGTSYLAKKRYYANHWNIWQTAYDEEGNLLELKDRKPKQIVYYLNVGFPQDKVYEDSVGLLQESWNEVFTKTVALTHNFTQLTGQSVYSWMMNLLAEANKADQAGSDVPTSDDIKKRLSYPSELAAQGLDYLKGIDAENPSPMAGGWSAFCSSHNALGASCASMTGDELKEAIDTRADSFSSTTTTYDLLEDPLFAAIFDLARVYMTSMGSEFAPTESKLDSYFKDVKGSIADKSMRSSLPEPIFDDAKGTKLLKFIAENNGGDKHMFLIKENSCSPKQLEAWKKDHGTVNDDVKNLFSEYGSDADSLGKLSVKDLRQFCAQLEWATKDEQDKSARFDWQRVGDLRYSFVNWVNSEVGYLGLGPSATDPETGEIISATANFAGRSIDAIAAGMTDMQLFRDGRISKEDLQTGAHIPEDLKAHGEQLGGIFLNKPASGQSSFDVLATRPTGPFANTNLAEVLKSGSGKPSAGNIESIKESINSLRKKIGEKEQHDVYKAAIALRDEKLKKISKLLSTPEALSALLADPAYAALIDVLAKERFGEGPYTDDQRMSVLAQVNAPMLVEREKAERDRKLAMHNLYPLTAMQNAMEGLITMKVWSEYFKDKPRDYIEDYIKKGVFYGVQLHELGHTFGLRHNFKGSTDAFNYNPGYWQVAAKSYEAGKKEAPWYLDRKAFEAFTGNKLPGSVEFYNDAEFRGTASIMDYTPDLNLDFTGLGSYDDAAIQFVYGKQIQVFDDSVRFDSSDAYFVDSQIVNYKDYPAIFAPEVLNKILRGEEVDYATKAKAYPAAIKKMLTARRWISIDEAMERQREEIKARTEVVSNALLNAGNIRNAIAKVNSFGLTTPVPYRFCSDEFANGSLNCEIWDWGSNQTEVVDYRINSYETSKVYARYARGKLGNGFLSSYMSRLIGTFQKVQQPFYVYSWIRRLGNLHDLGRDLEDASVKGLNFIAEISSQPSIGVYCEGSKLGGSPDLWYPLDMSEAHDKCNDSYKIITEEDGVQDLLKSSDTYLYYYLMVPSYYEKIYAMQSLFLVTGQFAQSSYTSLDIRDRDVSYWKVFKKRILDYFEAALMSDSTVFGGTMDKDGNYHPPVIVSEEEVNAIRDGRVPTPQEKDPYRNLPHVLTFPEFSALYNGIVYSLIINDTYIDDEVDMIQYLKVCASNDECDDDYLQVDAAYDDGADIKKGHKTVQGQDSMGAPIDIPLTTYYSKGGAFEIHTFYHPEAPIIYRAPMRKGQENTIGVKLIDRLNLIVYGSEEPDLKKVQELSPDARGTYLDAKVKLDEALAGHIPGANIKEIRKKYEQKNRLFQRYVSLVDMIRGIMKMSQGLY